MAKTDTIDATVLAHFAKVFQRRTTAPLTLLEAQIDEYVVSHPRDDGHPQPASPADHAIDPGRAGAAAHGRQARMQIGETQMAALVRSSDKRPLFDLLTGVPGVGALLACTLIASLRELGSLTRREIASLVGVAAMNNDSGRRRGHRFVMGGREAIRNVLYMATLTARRFNKPIKTFYGRLCDAGKPPKVALIACMRKLLTILNAMVRDCHSWRQEVAS